MRKETTNLRVVQANNKHLHDILHNYDDRSARLCRKVFPSAKGIEGTFECLFHSVYPEPLAIERKDTGETVLVFGLIPTDPHGVAATIWMLPTKLSKDNKLEMFRLLFANGERIMNESNYKYIELYELDDDTYGHKLAKKYGFHNMGRTSDENNEYTIYIKVLSKGE